MLQDTAFSGQEAPSRCSASEQPEALGQAKPRKNLLVTSSGCSTQPSLTSTQQQALSAIDARLHLLGDYAVEAFKCQLWEPSRAVQELEPDEAVMMCKLYDHVSAPDSVAVLSLRGALLGYVPRRHTHRFVHDTNFGHVYAINQDAAGLWRLTVACRPGLSPLTLDATPSNLLPHVDIHSALDPKEWARLQAATFERHGDKCEVCGPVDQFQCHEVWRFYEGYQVLKLMGFVPYHPDVCAVKRLEPCTPDDNKGMQHAKRVLQLMNEWDPKEVDDYVTYARELASRRSKQEWGFDLTWLQDNGFTIPAHLLSLCGTDIPRTVDQEQSREISDRRSAFVRGRCCFQ
ncbi:hypothetical protein ABBQ32_009651 [Trebouxia sp. C0010 RCD-2024]